VIAAGGLLDWKPPVEVMAMNMDDVMRLINPPRDPGDDEELHPDLAATISGEGDHCRMEHPHYSGSYSPGYNFRYNREYHAWQGQRAQLLEARDWKGFIAHHRSQFWLTALNEIEGQASPEEWAQAVRYVWYLSDVFWDRAEQWRAVLEKLKAGPGCMTPQERAELQGMPDPLEIFRGCRRETIHGFSWSLDPDKASYHAYKAVRKGLVVRATVARSKVIAFLDREEDEKEIIVFPEDVTGIQEA
jgi:hypothetical protein